MFQQRFRAKCQLAVLACGLWCGIVVTAEAQLTRNWWRPSSSCATCNWPAHAGVNRPYLPPQYSATSSTTESCDCQGPPAVAPVETTQIPSFPYGEVRHLAVNDPAGDSLIPPSPARSMAGKPAAIKNADSNQTLPSFLLEPAPLVEPRIVRMPAEALPSKTSTRQSATVNSVPNSHSGLKTVETLELPTISIPAPRTVAGPGVIPRTATRDEWEPIPTREPSSHGIPQTPR